jgi:hypothetical protein
LVDERTDVRTSLIGILGYAGAAAALAGVPIVIGTAANTTAHVTADVASVLVLVVAGGWIVGGRHEAHERMRSVLWFAAVAMWASAAVDLFAHGPDAIALHGKWLVVVTALLAAMLAFPLWALAPRSLQLVALVASVQVGCAAAVYSEGSFIGLSVPQLRWPAIVTIVVGLATLASGAFGFIRPKRTAMVLGSIAIIGGALFVDIDVLRQAPSDLSLWLALAASVAVLLLGDFVSDRAVSGIGIVGLVGAVAGIVHRRVLDRPTAVALVVLGTVALASCVLLARAFTHPMPTPPPEPPG